MFVADEIPDTLIKIIQGVFSFIKGKLLLKSFDTGLLVTYNNYISPLLPYKYSNIRITFGIILFKNIRFHNSNLLIFTLKFGKFRF